MKGRATKPAVVKAPPEPRWRFEAWTDTLGYWCARATRRGDSSWCYATGGYESKAEAIRRAMLWAGE